MRTGHVHVRLLDTDGCEARDEIRDRRQEDHVAPTRRAERPRDDEGIAQRDECDGDLRPEGLDRGGEKARTPGVLELVLDRGHSLSMRVGPVSVCDATRRLDTIPEVR